jgi:hypothetical protein
MDGAAECLDVSAWRIGRSDDGDFDAETKTLPEQNPKNTM